MPLYKIEEITTDAPTIRLVKAKSDAAALKHVTTPRFHVSIVTNPMEAADMAASGVRVETAGEEAETPTLAVVSEQNEAA